jgi:hypothetical protein
VFAAVFVRGVYLGSCVCGSICLLEAEVGRIAPRAVTDSSTTERVLSAMKRHSHALSVGAQLSAPPKKTAIHFRERGYCAERLNTGSTPRTGFDHWRHAGNRPGDATAPCARGRCEITGCDGCPRQLTRPPVPLRASTMQLRIKSGSHVAGWVRTSEWPCALMDSHLRYAAKAAARANPRQCTCKRSLVEVRL